MSLRGIAMRFGATRAVDVVDLDLDAGEIHGLIGENGAGKSTLMRVLAGFFDDYEGAIFIEGRETDIASPADARREGVALVHQELSLLPEFTVAENIFLGCEPGGVLPGAVSFARMRREAQRALSECGVSVDPAAKVESLSIAERQLVEIVKGVALAPRVLILDEPTSSLTIHEAQELFAILRRLASRRDGDRLHLSQARRNLRHHRSGHGAARRSQGCDGADRRMERSRRSCARWSAAISRRSSRMCPRRRARRASRFAAL